MRGKIFLVLWLLWFFIGEANQDETKQFLLKKIFPHSDILIVAFSSNSSIRNIFKEENDDFLHEWTSFEFCKSLSRYEENQLFIRDIRRKCYQVGLALGGNVSSTLEILKKEIANFNPKKIIMMGHSCGGYAALLFGSLLILDHFPIVEIHAFTPSQPLSLCQIKAEQYPYFERKFFHLDMLNMLGKEFEKGIFHVYYCENNRNDRKYIDRYLNFDWVRRHVVKGDKHNVAGVLKQQGLLQNIIDAAVKNAKEQCR